MASRTASKTFCNANTKRGKRCTKPAGWGTTHVGVGTCKMHGGSTPNAAKHAAVEIAASLGVKVELTPHEALIACVQITAGEVAYSTMQIQALTQDEYVGPRLQTKDVQLGEDGSVFEEKDLGPEMHIWIRARHEALDRLARFSKMALDAGVDERRVQLAENMASMLAPVLDAIFKELKLTPAQQKKAPAILERNLVALEGDPMTAAVNGDGVESD